MLSARFAEHTGCTRTRALVSSVVALVLIVIVAAQRPFGGAVSLAEDGGAASGNVPGAVAPRSDPSEEPVASPADAYRDPSGDGDDEGGVKAKIGRGDDDDMIETPSGKVRRTSGKSKDEADALSRGLLDRIGDGLGPLIVGGIGDSGTRGVRDVMIHLGAQMLGVGLCVAARSRTALGRRN